MTFHKRYFRPSETLLHFVLIYTYLYTLTLRHAVTYFLIYFCRDRMKHEIF